MAEWGFLREGLGNGKRVCLGPSVLRETHLNLSLPTDIGPVTLTADPVVFQRELRELYVQVGCLPSLLFFLFHDRAQSLCATWEPRWRPLPPGPASPSVCSPHRSLGPRSQYLLGSFPLSMKQIPHRALVPVGAGLMNE